MINISNAIKRPFSDIKKSGILTLLYIIPFVNIILGIFATGWLLEVAKTSMKNKQKLPEWNNWGDLFVQGLLMIIISFLWFIPALLILVIFGGTAIATYIATQSLPQTIAAAGIGFVLFIAMALLITYISPAAILSYAEKNKFSAAFQFKKIFKKAFSGGWFVAWIVGYVWYMAIFGVATAASIPFSLFVGQFAGFVVSTILTAIALPIAAIPFFTMLGEAYGKSQ
jgi:hypothetical protein